MKVIRKEILTTLALLAATHANAQCIECATDQLATTAPHRNIWSGLTYEETTSVATLLREQFAKFNLTTVPGPAASRQNSITQIELLQPNKTDATVYLDKKGNLPTRYARAVILFASPDEPYFQEYSVGPLPVSKSTTVKQLTFLYNNKTPGKVNVPPAYLGDDLVKLLFEYGSSIKDITQQLWNASTDDAISFHVVTPFWKENEKLITWAEFVNKPTSRFDSAYLLPLGLFTRFDVTGRDPSKWSATGCFYNGKFYESTAVFRQAVKSPRFEKIGQNTDGPWTSTDKAGDPMPFDELPPPAPVSVGIKRFSIDYKENFISWMDFSFYLTVTRDTGLRLFDINYKSKRIIFELGIEDAFTHYAGADPVNSGSAFFDIQQGLGLSTTSLVKGYDCPSYATFMNATWSSGEGISTQPNGICIFEMDTGYPIQRHTVPNMYTSVTKNIVLIARTIFTVGNYDFLISYTFQLDGSIEVSARASGYIKGAHAAHNEDYGFKIHDNLSGAMHDHVITFKADLDILGTKNSFQKIEFVPASVKYPWSGSKRKNTMKILRSFIRSEDQSKINWGPNGATAYAVVNKDVPNQYGELRGYKIRPTAGTAHLTIEDSSYIGNAAHYTSHNLYVTKQKDTEAHALHANGPFDPDDPIINFSKYFDGESLDQEDLVIWFNLGMHHLPHSGDIPNTLFSYAHSAMSIEPMNYLERDATRSTAQQVRIDYTADGKVSAVERFGGRQASCLVNALNPFV